jgi:hypothetical protein
MRRLLFGLLVLGASCTTHRDALMSGHRYRVFFPAIKLASTDGERIDSLEIVVSCGRFHAISAIPSDWSAQVVSPVSAQTKLLASAGHGASTLWNMHGMDGGITVVVEDASCFDIAATVGTTATEHKYARSDLILRP